MTQWEPHYKRSNTSIIWLLAFLLMLLLIFFALDESPEEYEQYLHTQRVMLALVGDN